MMSLVFIGTGASCAIPVIGHLNRGTSCVCQDAMDNPNSLNRRNNVSLLIHLPKETIQNVCSNTHSTETDAEEAGPRKSKTEGKYFIWNRENSEKDINILIDCGKTFRHAYFSILAPRQIHYVDVLLLTHGHSDAMQGVADLCELHAGARRQVGCSRDHPTMTVLVKRNSTLLPEALRRSRIQTYLTASSLKNIRVMFPEIMHRSRHLGASPEDMAAYVKQINQVDAQGAHQKEDEDGFEDSSVGLDFFLIHENAPIPLYIDALDGLIPIYSLPVEHGKDYISLGFVFGRGTAFKSQSSGTTGAATTAQDEMKEKSCVVYISDVSSIPEASMNFLLDLVKIDVLIFDLLSTKGSSSLPHTCWDDIMPYLRLLTPKRTFFVGMYCSLEHKASNIQWEMDIVEEKKRVKEILLSHSQSSTPEGATWDERHSAMEFHEDQEASWRRFLEIETPKMAYDDLEVQLPL